ncbi:MAG: hypothetical protein K6F66_07835 [Pseudobutyrivibrio sp.]|nr:hypothetical protein [Pseudobutyrivibrio sp.]
MEFNVVRIFEDVDRMSKVKTKKEYESYMNVFKSERLDMLKDYTEAEDKKAAAEVFCQAVEDEFKKFGKVRGGDMMNLNYFMIYFIFPAILSEKEDGKESCDLLRDVWNDHFKASVNYTDYDSLMEGFRTKIFGIPIGK